MSSPSAPAPVTSTEPIQESKTEAPATRMITTKDGTTRPMTSAEEEYLVLGQHTDTMLMAEFNTEFPDAKGMMDSCKSDEMRLELFAQISNFWFGKFPNTAHGEAVPPTTQACRQICKQRIEQTLAMANAFGFKSTDITTYIAAHSVAMVVDKVSGDEKDDDEEDEQSSYAVQPTKSSAGRRNERRRRKANALRSTGAITNMSSSSTTPSFIATAKKDFTRGEELARLAQDAAKRAKALVDA